MRKSYKFLFSAITALGLFPWQADAQLRAYMGERGFVNTPAPIEGGFDYNSTNDGNPNTTTNWGRAIDSIWANVKVVATVPYEACGSVTNGAALAGNFALISRGNCDFLEKAYNAVQAGAIGVIIANNTTGTISMSANLADARVNSLVRIPIISITQVLGDTLKANLDRSQNVTVTLTDWGLNKSRDLAFRPNAPAPYHGYAIPLAALKGNQSAPYRFYNSSVIVNTGTANQGDVKLKQTVSFVPTGSTAATALIKDSIEILSFAVADSILIANSPSSLTNFLDTLTRTGELKMRYELSSATGDDFLHDNVQEYSVYVTDSVFSKTTWNNVDKEPNYTVAYKLNTTSELLWGPMFYSGVDSLVAKSAKFAVSMGTTADPDGLLLKSHLPILVTLFSWNDYDADGEFDVTELNMVAMAEKFFGTDDEPFKFTEVDFVPTTGSGKVWLNKNTWYWVAVDAGNDLFVAAETEKNSDYYARMYASEMSSGMSVKADREYYGPAYDGNSALTNTPDFRMFPFYPPTHHSTYTIDQLVLLSTFAPSVSFKVYSGKGATNVEELASNASAIKMYPNPISTEYLTIELDVNNPNAEVNYTIMDGLGKVVGRYQDQLQGGKLSVSTSNLSNGQYFIMLGADKGNDRKLMGGKFTVQK